MPLGNIGSKFLFFQFHLWPLQSFCGPYTGSFLRAGEKILLCTMVLFAINIFAVVMLNYLDREQQLIQDNLVLRQNIKYQNDTVEAWPTPIRTQRKLTHDFQNQLSVICGMAER